ncbi:MAG: DHHA1 domain-containing protein, partial [Dokdonia donghaensis]|nr:DHHA1 domain-containing protein [Dokdonia donghaensis]
TDLETATKFASEIEQYNSDRKEADKSITQQALDQIIENQEEGNKTTVVFQEDWHKGVIGIVASRLIETYYRPTLVFTRSGDKYAASARSVKGFDVYNALHECAEHIEQFGGHKYAAGLTLLPEQYEAFKAKFEEVVAASCDERLLVPEISIDSEINLADITPKFHRIIKQFAPFGPRNMSPTFMTKNLTDTGYGKKVGADQTHLKAAVVQNSRGTQIGCIGFNLGDKYDLITNKKPFMAAYAIDENEWNGNVSLQLRLKDIK